MLDDLVERLLRIWALKLTSSADTAGMSSAMAMASETLALSGLRLAMAVSAKRACAEEMISTRSASDKSGEYSRMAAAASSISCASLSMMRLGTQSSALISSARMRRTRCASFSIVSIVRLRIFSLASGGRVGSSLADLARQLGTNVAVIVIGQEAIGMGRCGAVGGDGAACL